MRHFRKINGRRIKRGFSLAEMLAAMLILLMVSAVVAAGIPAAKNAYEKVTLASNAQVLISTASSALRDELGTAREIEIEDGTGIRYYSSRTGSYSRIFLGTEGEQKGLILVEEYIGFPGIGSSSGNAGASGSGDSSSTGKIRQLVTAAASTKELYVTYGSVSFADGLLTFSNLKVFRSSERGTENPKPMEEMSELVIRPAVQ